MDAGEHAERCRTPGDPPMYAAAESGGPVRVPRDALAPPAGSTDGALLATIAWCNRRLLDDAEHGRPTEPALAARANAAWLSLLRESHGDAVTGAHVQRYYNAVLLSLRRRRVVLGDHVALRVRDPMDAVFAGDGAGATRPPRDDAHAVWAVPYELTRDFFVEVRKRTRPWEDALGDDGFHHYLSRCAMRAAERRRRDDAFLVRGARGDATIGHAEDDGGGDPRSVHAVLLAAMASPAVLETLLTAPALVDDEPRRLLARYVDGGGAGVIVSAKAVQPVLHEALDRLVRFQGFVPPLPTGLESLAAPLLRRRKSWELLWATWCARADAPTIPSRDVTDDARDALRARLRRRGVVLPPAELDRHVARYLAARAAAAERDAREDVLQEVVARFAALAAEGLAQAESLASTDERAIIAGLRAGAPAARIAGALGRTDGWLYKRFQRLGERIAHRVAERVAAWRPRAHVAPHPPSFDADD